MSRVVPMARLFKACVDVLAESMTPTHYRTLTSNGLARISVRPEEVDMARQVEDVREKLLEAGNRETGYLGSPHCLGFMRRWFVTSQPDLLQWDRIEIAPSIESGCRAARDAILRTRWMITKTSASEERVAEGRARGLVVEHHVVDWFRERWPAMVLAADNDGKWKDPCNHDFKLSHGDMTLLVDVWGANVRKQYTPPEGKHPADLHLQCKLQAGRIWWEGVATGSQFCDGVLPTQSRSPQRMCVWLNCLAASLPYRELSEAAA